MIIRETLLVIVLTMSILGCKKDTINYSMDKILTSKEAMVSSAHPLASDAGVEVMREGGNAIDAMVSMHFALAVVYPRAGNIGGGGFMVFKPLKGKAETLDFREMAPREARRDMYLDDKDDVIPGLSKAGGLAIGVPGSVKGMAEAHAKYGKLSWSSVLEPAVRLANQGFRLTALEAERLNKFKSDFQKYNGKDIPFIKSATWEEGHLLVQKNLGATLTTISEKKADGFYKGKVAVDLLGTLREHNGIITQYDLDDYQAVWRDPVSTDYKGHTIISMPPPSSGGIALNQLCEIIEYHNLDQIPFHSAESIHLMAESERRVYADRAKHLGDSDYYPVPLDSLMSPIYLAQQALSISKDSATISESVFAGEFQDLESYETTHYSIVDKEGNAVSVTTTLNSNYGSKVFVKEAGFFLNNEMDDFSAKPGVPNQFGLIGNEANAIEPGKRMLSSMTPTIVTKDGEVMLVLGSPGGSTIITSVFQVITNMIDYNMPLDEAVAAPRYHHQWLPDRIMMEEGKFDDTLIEALKQMGHEIGFAKYIGLVDAVAKTKDGWMGVGDPRGDDDAEGL